MRKTQMFALVFLALMPAAFSDTYLVRPDGTGDFANIQEAVDFAQSGDEILLADGVFHGLGMDQIQFWGKDLTVRSQSGRPATCILDGHGEIGLPRSQFLFENGEGPGAMVRDVTLYRGSTSTIC